MAEYNLEFSSITSWQWTTKLAFLLEQAEYIFTAKTSYQETAGLIFLLEQA